MKDFVCFLHIFTHYSLLHLSWALRSLKYSLISGCQQGVASLCVAHTQFISLFRLKSICICSKLFGIL